MKPVGLKNQAANEADFMRNDCKLQHFGGYNTALGLEKSPIK